MRISDWSSDVCSSDLRRRARRHGPSLNSATVAQNEQCLHIGKLRFPRDRFRERRPAFTKLEFIPMDIRRAHVLFKDRRAGLLEETPRGGSVFSYLDGWTETIACALQAAESRSNWDVGLHPVFQWSEEHTSELPSLIRISY